MNKQVAPVKPTVDTTMLAWENEGGMIPPFVILRKEQRAKVSAILRPQAVTRKP